MTKENGKVWFGGDYNPEQWDDHTIDEDMRLFKKAGISLVTLPVFAWAKLEPDEGVYNFGWLDKLMDKLHENGLKVCLATPTTAQPAWLSARYPEVLPVDIQGRRHTHGMRVSFCCNSLKYRERAAAIAEVMSRRYGSHPALAIWHVANEYGTYCYCPQCQAKFRLWLRQRYGTLENLNDRWYTAFWGRTLYSFEEAGLPTELNDDYRFSPTIQLDYLRFVTDSTVECFKNEYDAIRRHCPGIPIQTNMSGFIKKLDKFKLAAVMDVVGWDNYPAPTHDRSLVAFKHDLMRGLKDGQSFYLMEQSPNQQNWQPYNKLKRPGEVRVLSYQAMAHGADTCLFFQMRQSAAGQEKFHGAIISHSGRDDTRVFREISRIGAELDAIGGAFLGGRIHARVGLLFDWENWWALEQSSGPSKDMDYLETARRYYAPFYENNIPVDILGTHRSLDGYAVILAPMLYMVKPGVAERIADYVRGGGTLITTTMTGLADENDHCSYGAYPGKLRETLGIRVEETDALYPYEKNSMVFAAPVPGFAPEYGCGFLCDVLHAETAECLAVYGGDFYAGTPCFTVNRYGKGTAYYIGTEPDAAFLTALAKSVCGQAGLAPDYIASAGVEITTRVTDTAKVVFIINHNSGDSTVDLGSECLLNLMDGSSLTGTVTLPGREVLVLKKG
jgi:beta-galactosidase